MSDPTPAYAPSGCEKCGVLHRSDSSCLISHQCEMSDQPLIVDAMAACPGCGHMVKIKLVGGYPNGLWKFAEHSRHNGSECKDTE